MQSTRLWTWRSALWVRPGPAGAAQELLTASARGSWPVTCRQPALGRNVDDDPESQRTVISRPSTSVTTPLRVADPTFSDSTSTRSPTSTRYHLKLWIGVLD